MSAMRLCVLEEDLRPDDLSITLTCSAAACRAPIRKGQKYGILPNTNLIYCAGCSSAPLPVTPAAQPSPVATARKARPPRQPKPAAPKKANGGQPLPAGQWAKEYERCSQCGTTDRPHHSHGLCQRCNSAEQRRRQPTMATLGLACRNCGSDDEPMKARGLCTRCYKRQYHATRLVTATGVHPSQCACFGCAEKRQAAGQMSHGVDWRGMPFAEAG